MLYLFNKGPRAEKSLDLDEEVERREKKVSKTCSTVRNQETRIPDYSKGWIKIGVAIAIDVASALDYLHNHCHIPVIHCDIKPSNILLDNDITAHVSDFSLARLLQFHNDEVSNSQTSFVGIKGTIGYAAPKYGMGSVVSTSGDVYSYGILLLELFIGKRPTGGMFKDGLNLYKLAKIALLERAMEIVDQKLVSTIEEEETTSINSRTQMGREKSHECLTLMLKIGVVCSHGNE
ncbi:putative receptor-like protein kinase At3g47110 [Camellia sinensis]|uniref:putative receptor-like protein kinase At3g47110 n=1 Tax=Camellia sinensis TaxID=4442 RepID=UPI00103692FC|nr:putative receptor-like protein kinase At3g47110 [Camellia sinensis]